MNAVIYCRVSSEEQIKGTSLDSQEEACLDYARRHNMTVSKVFVEEGESAKFADRTQLLELLSYCRNKSHQIEVLLVWKIDRFARNTDDHYAIKAALRKHGVRVLSATEPIQDDPNGRLMESILAGVAQWDNDIRAQRTVHGMQQRLREGIWPWRPPLGYLPPRIGKKSQPDEPDPRFFEQIKKAWHMFATGAYTKADIRRLLHKWGIRVGGGRPISAQSLDNLFANPYYAGVLRDPWTNKEYAGRHPTMVTQAEFAQVQEIVRGRNRSVPHHRLTDDFPLRGQVRCPSCGQYMTGYFAQGKTQRYPYYKCFWHDCPTRTRSYPAGAVHQEFSQLLADTSVPHYLAGSIVTEIVKAYWEARDLNRAKAKRQRGETDNLRQQLDELVSMRAARLISDDEFVSQRSQLRGRLYKIQAAADAKDQEPGLSETDIADLTGVISDLGASWWSLPTEAKRGFAEILLPSGYTFQRLRTPEKGLLIKAIEPSDEVTSTLAAFTRENANALMKEIRKLLTLIRMKPEPDKKAA
jgi:DNA invertase Pin-like site-specific DNA recombinase